MSERQPEFCTSCGARSVPDQNFCSNCGSGLPDSANPGHIPINDVGTGAGVSTKRRIALILVPIAVAVLVLGAIGWTLIQRSQSTQQSASTASNRPTPTPTPTPTSRTSAPAPPSVSGEYKGRMYGDNGTYNFVLNLREGSGDSVTGRMEQTHSYKTYAGTEILSGRVSGRRVVLSTVRWTADTDPDWQSKYEKFKLTFSQDRESFSGEFICDICGTGWQEIRTFR